MAQFRIDNGNQLVLNEALDYDVAQSHTVTIRATSLAGTYDEAFTVNVTEVIPATPPSVVSSATSGNTPRASTSRVLTMPSGIVVGNRGLAFTRCTNNRNIVTTSGFGALWTQIYSENSLQVWTRIFDGTESDGDNPKAFTSNSCRTYGVVLQIDGSAAGNPTVVGAQSDDPPTATVAESKPTLWLPCFSFDTCLLGGTASAPPTNYSNWWACQHDDQTSSTASFGGLAVAWRAATAASENPAPFTYDNKNGISTSIQTQCVTVAVETFS